MSVFIWLILLLPTSLCAEKIPSSIVDALLTSRTNNKFFRDRFVDISDYSANEKRSGLFLTTTLVPGAGRLLIRRTTNDGFDSCSGVAISRGLFLTAAHCVCKFSTGHAKNAAECDNRTSELKLHVFIPAEGVFDVKTKPVVHPNYNSPTLLQPAHMGDLQSSALAVADLAIVRFEGGKEHVQVDSDERLGKFVVASYGTLYFAIEEYARNMGFEIGRPIAPGVGQVSRLQQLLASRQDCGRYHARDTACSTYSAIQVEAGPLQDTTVCQGDSGGAVLSRTQGGKWSVNAVVSYFSPPNQFDRCDGVTAGKRTHYTDLSHYRGWLQTQIDRETAPTTDHSKSNRSCVDGILGAGTFDVVGFVGFVSVTEILKRPAPDAKRAVLSILPAAYCRNDAIFGVTACEVARPSYLSLEISSDLAQVTLCNGG